MDYHARMDEHIPYRTCLRASFLQLLFIVLLLPEEVVALEDDPPRSYCVERLLPSTQDLVVRVDIIDAVGELSVLPVMSL